MANELVKLVAKKANIAEPIAQIAVDVVINSLKSKLPPAVGNTLNSFLGSSSTATASKTTKTSSAKKNDDLLGGLGNIAGTIGGLLGKK